MVHLENTVVVLPQIQPVVCLEHLVHKLSQTHSHVTFQPGLDTEQTTTKPQQVTVIQYDMIQ